MFFKFIWDQLCEPQRHLTRLCLESKIGLPECGNPTPNASKWLTNWGKNSILCALLRVGRKSINTAIFNKQLFELKVKQTDYGVRLWPIQHKPEKEPARQKPVVS